MSVQWMCDRCEQLVPQPNRKNKRPDGWQTVRSGIPGQDSVTSYLLCKRCASDFKSFLNPPRSAND